MLAAPNSVQIYAQDPNSRQQSWLLTRQVRSPSLSPGASRPARSRADVPLAHPPSLLARGKASPGNLSAVEDLLFTSHDLLSSPVTLALKVSSGQDGGVRTVGAAFADVSARSLGLAEFADNDVFSNAESLVIQLGVKEAVIVDDVKGKDYDLAKIEVMLERCGVVTTKIRSSASAPAAPPLATHATDRRVLPTSRRVQRQERRAGSRPAAQGQAGADHPCVASCRR